MKKFANNNAIYIDALPSTNGAYRAELITAATVDTNSGGIGAALTLASDGHYDMANARGITLRCSAIAVQSGTGTNKLVMLRGFICNTGWSFTVGGDVWLSTRYGTFTQTQPSTTGNCIQYCGRAMSATCLYFNPSAIYYTRA